MISFKKSYAEQLFQLALALSLLRVDPENYLGLGWESQLASLHDGGDGWQLELRAAPLTDYPYANRKALMPLIEDLARFRETANSYDVTAYLLNVQNDHQTALNSDTNNNNNNNATEQRNTTAEISIANSGEHFQDDFFLNSDQFDETLSIFDQTLADLNDYDELQHPFSFLSMPLKDEPPEIPSHEPIFEVRRERASTSFSSGFESLNSPESNYSSSAVIDWNDYFETKEELEEEIEDDIKIKKEIIDENNNSTLADDDFDLKPETSDLIEVLWKQDVDLGFCLPQPESEKKKSDKCEEADDEIEKLKALLEVKQDEQEEKEKSIEDEWAGFNVTIDSETGEYIQLPPLQLDDTLLDEVLQLPAFDLLTDEDEKTVDETKSLSSETQSSETSETIPTAESDKLKSKSSQPEEKKTETDSPEGEKLDDTDTVGLVDLLDLMMIQSSSAPFQHPRPTPNYGHGMNSFRQSSYHHHQPRVPLNRTVSMEQRWQDLTNLLSLPPGMGVGMGVGEMAPPHPHYAPHYPHYQAAAPMSMSQHGQFPHHPHSVLHHNASLADLGPAQPHYGPNLGSAVATSMHLTNSSSETDGASGYKMDHDLMYYSNASSELNHTNDGFINSINGNIWNDDDMQLVDMAVNVNMNDSMYGLKILEQNSTSNNSSVLGSASAGSHGGSNGLLSSPMHTNLGQLVPLGGSHGDRLEQSSDSALSSMSSMGSERASLSDGEWGDAGSDSAQEYHRTKYGPFDYSYNSRLGDTPRQPPVAQKKHQMFGKRYFQEQSTISPLTQQPPVPQNEVPGSIKYEYDPYVMQQSPIIPHNLEGAVGPISKQLNESEIKYSCSVDFTRHSRQMQDLVTHNHSYTLPQGSGATPRPQPRDKKLKKPEDEHLTRDEKKAREHKIPMTVQDIINLPMDEFNERLSKYDLTEVQLSLIRDIRRRGKNKVAAQNCRKRKLDQILTLADEVKEVRKRKERLINDREQALAEKKSIMDKFSTLYRHVFQYLRDPDGNLYSPARYSLQLGANGNVFILPRENSQENTTTSHNGNHHHNQQGSSHHHHHHHHHSHQKE